MSATLSLSADAPNEAITFSLGQETFDLSPGESVEVDNADVVSNAIVHPWIDVTQPDAEVYISEAHKTLAPEDDALRQEGQLLDPNDPDEVRKAEEAKSNVVPGTVAPAVEVEETTQDAEPFNFGFGDDEEVAN